MSQDRRERASEQRRPIGPMGRPGGSHGGPMGGFGRPVEKPKDFKGTLKRLVKYFKPYTWGFIIVGFFAIASTIFSIFSPKVMGQATTELFNGLIAKMQHLPGAGVNFDAILSILITLAVLYIGASVMSYVQQYIMAGISQKIVRKMRNDINDKLTKLPLKYYDGRTHGEILSRITNDVDIVSSTLQQGLTQIISSVATIIGVVIMMLTISPLLTLIVIAVLPLSAIATALIAKRSQKQFAGQQKTLGILNGIVEESYGGHNIVKAFGKERDNIEKFDKTNKRLFGYSWRAQFVSGMIWPIVSFVSNLGYVAICVAGGIMMTQRAIQIGDIQAFIQYARMFTQPIMQTANIANILQSTIAGAERVFELLDEKEEMPDSKGAGDLPLARGDVAFQHVRFGYTEGEPLIHDLSIAVKKGQTVAIVGPTGAGKTTLVNLLMRFYEIKGGRITVDGRDIRDLRRDGLRSVFGMVLQDTWLFNGTIRDNIAYGCEGATDEQVYRAAQAAHADHFIRTLPQGYDTVLNEEASNISQGQKQLLTIARAVLADPAVLILDEATSSVDTRTEVLIQEAMKKLMRGRTSFVIAHRLSTIRGADRILVMNEGDIIEQGTHKELLEKGGFYAELYNSQFTGSFADEKAV
ncbi:MAG: ABC transporter ATP-binding protein [Bacillota bacterium]|nr:ABC transporter ATP-binding protein [Bacillota bacterium]